MGENVTEDDGILAYCYLQKQPSKAEHVSKNSTSVYLEPWMLSSFINMSYSVGNKTSLLEDT